MEGEIIALAFGTDAPAAAQHAAVCPRCGLLLSQFRKIADRLAEPAFNAPASLVETVKAMTLPQFTPRARLLSLVFAGSGARSASSDTLVAVVDADGTTLQIMYRRVSAGWEVRSRLQGGEWAVFRGGKRIRLDPEGGFVIRAKGLADTDFTLKGPDTSILVPPATEWTENDTTGPS